jgi:hypothetical protein
MCPKKIFTLAIQVRINYLQCASGPGPSGYIRLSHYYKAVTTGKINAVTVGTLGMRG